MMKKGSRWFLNVKFNKKNQANQKFSSSFYDFQKINLKNAWDKVLQETPFNFFDVSISPDSLSPPSRAIS